MKKIIISAGIVTALLFALLIYIVVREDKTAPIILINNNNLVYREGEDMALLLQGITAKDDVDGDVTSTVMVGDLITMPDGTAAKITYLAKDSSNNVGQLDLLIPYETGKVALTDEKATAQADNAPITADAMRLDNVVATVKKQPVVELLNAEVKINKGDEFDPKAYIKNISDDKDSVQSLLEGVTVTGTYNLNKRGTYPIQLEVKDSEGNQSEKVSLVLKVE